jgi:hypothetical protein
MRIKAWTVVLARNCRIAAALSSSAIRAPIFFGAWWTGVFAGVFAKMWWQIVVF